MRIVIWLPDIKLLQMYLKYKKIKMNQVQLSANINKVTGSMHPLQVNI